MRMRSFKQAQFHNPIWFSVCLTWKVWIFLFRIKLYKYSPNPGGQKKKNYFVFIISSGDIRIIHPSNCKNSVVSWSEEGGDGCGRWWRQGERQGESKRKRERRGTRWNVRTLAMQSSPVLCLFSSQGLRQLPLSLSLSVCVILMMKWLLIQMCVIVWWMVV